jgi:preprotein translocase subunit SecF
MIKNLERWLLVSVGTIVVSVVLIVGVGPQFGTDFTGGTLLEYKLPSEASDTITHAITEVAAQELQLSVTAQVTRDNTVLVRTVPLDDSQHEKLTELLSEKNLVGEELRFESIGPTIGTELQRKARLSVLLAVTGMIAYLTYAFRRTVGLISPWKFGVAATYALVHDLLFVTAVFVILGKVYGATIDSLFVTALLSVMGYSANDTIVIFDRLREEWIKSRGLSLREAITHAVQASVVRSLNTSITIFLVLLALLLLGGTTIRWFIVALMAGTIVGTYSSIFVAAPALHFLAGRFRKK